MDVSSLGNSVAAPRSTATTSKKLQIQHRLDRVQLKVRYLRKLRPTLFLLCKHPAIWVEKKEALSFRTIRVQQTYKPPNSDQADR